MSTHIYNEKCDSIKEDKMSRHVAWVGEMRNAHINFLKDFKERGFLDNVKVINNCMH
jgi:hypothetical protein